MNDHNKTLPASPSYASASAVYAGVRSGEQRQSRAAPPKGSRCARGGNQR